MSKQAHTTGIQVTPTFSKSLPKRSAVHVRQPSYGNMVQLQAQWPGYGNMVQFQTL